VSAKSFLARVRPAARRDETAGLAPAPLSPRPGVTVADVPLVHADPGLFTRGKLGRYHPPLMLIVYRDLSVYRDLAVRGMTHIFADCRALPVSVSRVDVGCEYLYAVEPTVCLLCAQRDEATNVLAWWATLWVTRTVDALDRAAGALRTWSSQPNAATFIAEVQRGERVREELLCYSSVTQGLADPLEDVVYASGVSLRLWLLNFLDEALGAARLRLHKSGAVDDDALSVPQRNALLACVVVNLMDAPAAGGQTFLDRAPHLPVSCAYQGSQNAGVSACAELVRFLTTSGKESTETLDQALLGVFAKMRDLTSFEVAREYRGCGAEDVPARRAQWERDFDEFALAFTRFVCRSVDKELAGDLLWVDVHAPVSHRFELWSSRVSDVVRVFVPTTLRDYSQARVRVPVPVAAFIVSCYLDSFPRSVPVVTPVSLEDEFLISAALALFDAGETSPLRDLSLCVRTAREALTPAA
jgi:hypothetical protein